MKLRLPVLAGMIVLGFSFAAVAGSDTATKIVTVWETQPDAGEKPPVHQLVQLRGRFVAITATGKRHQSYIFEFRVSEQLNGPSQAPTAKDQLVRFELFDGGGGRELLAKLGGVMEPKKLEDLPKTPRYDVVFWLSPRDAVIVGLPVPVKEQPR